MHQEGCLLSDEETLSSHFALKPQLRFPASFGTVYAGGEFRALLCLSLLQRSSENTTHIEEQRHLSEDYAVQLNVSLQKPGGDRKDLGSFSRTLSHTSTNHDSTLDCLVHQAIELAGAHLLIVGISYRPVAASMTSDGAQSAPSAVEFTKTYNFECQDALSISHDIRRSTLIQWDADLQTIFAEVTIRSQSLEDLYGQSFYLCLILLTLPDVMSSV